jgi:hypothetical protein
MSQGIQVGDAVLRFLGDTTDLDAAYTKVDGMPQRIAPATEAIKGMGREIEVTSTGAKEMGNVMNLAGEKAQFSMYEAKGEIGLLGEEIGVHLPRHVRSFVAELPGVGQALTAAFSATAVLFVIQALIEITQKASELTAELAFGTKGAEENEKAIKALNVQLLDLAKQYAEAKKKADDYGKSAIQLANENRQQVQTSIKDLNAELKREGEELDSLTAKMKEHGRERISFSQAYDMAKRGQLGYLEAITAVTVGETKAVLLKGQLKEKEDEQTVTTKKLSVAHEELRVATNNVATAQKKLNEEYEKALASLDRSLKELMKANDEYNKIARNSTVAVEAQITVLPKLVQEILNTATAYKTLGVTSVGSYEMQKEAAQKAYSQIYAAEQKGLATNRDVIQSRMKLVQVELLLAKARGTSTAALDREMKELKKMSGETQDFGKVAKQVADSVSHAVTQTAFAYGQGAITIGQALRQITSSIISEVAKQAEVKGAAALAEAFNAFGHYDFTAGSHFLASAAAWFALGGGISAAAGAVAGSSATPGTAANPVNITGTAGAATAGAPKPVGGVNVQAFATGGLITKPTLALLAEKPGTKGELAIPLDDPQAKKHIRDAVGGGDGDGQIHVHVQGLISPDNLGKVIQKINQRVKRGSSFLTSSDSHRITRRSA